MTADECTKGHAILATEGVVTHKRVKASVVLVGKVLPSLHLQGHFQVSDTFLQPLDTHLVATSPQKGVHFILMENLAQPRPHDRGHTVRLVPHLAAEYLVDVYGLL